MYAKDFEYDGQLLSDYGLILCNFDSNKGLETVSSGADISFNQFSPSGGNHFLIGSSTYDSAYTATFQICRNPCLVSSQDEMVISTEEISAIQRWLCRKKYYKFKIIQEDYEDLYWNVVFSTKQIELQGEVIGFELTLLTDADYGYLEDVSVEYNCLADTPFYFYDISDEEGYINPNLEITFLEDGKDEFDNDVLIKSKVFKLQHCEEDLLDNRITEIKKCSSGEKIIIDGKNQIISTSFSEHKLSDNFNYMFPRLYSIYNGLLDNGTKNMFITNIDCKIKLSYSPIRKIGL
jgi:hypothetical protein